MIGQTVPAEGLGADGKHQCLTETQLECFVQRGTSSVACHRGTQNAADWCG